MSGFGGLPTTWGFDPKKIFFYEIIFGDTIEFGALFFSNFALCFLRAFHPGFLGERAHEGAANSIGSRLFVDSGCWTKTRGSPTARVSSMRALLHPLFEKDEEGV